MRKFGPVPDRALAAVTEDRLQWDYQCRGCRTLGKWPSNPELPDMCTRCGERVDPIPLPSWAWVNFCAQYFEYDTFEYHGYQWTRNIPTEQQWRLTKAFLLKRYWEPTDARKVNAFIVKKLK